MEEKHDDKDEKEEKKKEQKVLFKVDEKKQKELDEMWKNVKAYPELK